MSRVIFYIEGVVLFLQYLTNNTGFFPESSVIIFPAAYFLPTISLI